MMNLKIKQERYLLTSIVMPQSGDQKLKEIDKSYLVSILQLFQP